jgi:hypothetical protein
MEVGVEGIDKEKKKTKIEKKGRESEKYLEETNNVRGNVLLASFHLHKLLVLLELKRREGVKCELPA